MTKQVTVGDIIKSYDFQRRTDCYILGQVKSVKDGGIVAKVIRAVSQEKEYKFPDTEFATLEQGLGMFDDTWQRVVVVG
jgi:hypothetical protein